MYYRAMTVNMRTKEVVDLGIHNTDEPAEFWWERDDDPTEWVMSFGKVSEKEISEWEESHYYDSDDDLEMGFDPYEGCYTYDC